MFRTLSGMASTSLGSLSTGWGGEEASTRGQLHEERLKEERDGKEGMRGTRGS